jgi:DNA-binding transcriptional MocR family regulator
MMEHAKILRPKFELVLDSFEKGFSDVDLVRWTKPHGGYFISFYGKKGTAKSIVAKCKELGVKLTDAGASYPYHKDPDDSNIRIAPSYPGIKDLEVALKVFITVVKYVTVEKIIQEK